jgi:hypothetical protein
LIFFKVDIIRTVKNWSLILSLAPTLLYSSLMALFIPISRAEFLRPYIANFMRWIAELEKGPLALASWAVATASASVRFMIN